MGTAIAYIVAVLFALCAFAVLGLVLAADIVRTKEYLSASRTMAQVVRQEGERRTANYGFQQAAAKYYGYQVSYTVGGKSCSGIHLSKKDIFREGDTVEIRYVMRRNGTPEIVNRDIKDRFFRLLLCAAIAVPVCIIGIVLF